MPDTFLSTISESITSLNKNLSHKIFWNIDLFEKNVYKDTSVIKSLSNISIIGIFSKGDVDFQKQKILFINEFLNNDNVYIFPDKIDKIQEVLGSYQDYEIYLVDNEAEVLNRAKELFPNISAILIDRKNQYQNGENLIKISNLNELKSIIYD